MTSAAFADLMAVLEEQESSSTEPAGPKEETVSIETITYESRPRKLSRPTLTATEQSSNQLG